LNEATHGKDYNYPFAYRLLKGDTMAEIDPQVSRREAFGLGSAALAAALAAAASKQASAQALKPANHNAPNETDPGQQNIALAGENPDSEWPASTDHGTVKPFKYSFALSHKRIENGGWTRQVSARELPISTTMSGVEMRLTAGGVRELHWHVEAEWSIMLYGNARITAVDQTGKSFVSDVTEGDLWLFPPGIPHSIQGLGPDGCRFLLVFDDGNFDEFHTFLITDWLSHTPQEVLAKNFNVQPAVFDKVPKKELFIFQTGLPGALRTEQAQAAEGTGTVEKRFDFKASTMQPTKMTPGGSVKIIDSKIFPVTPITAAIVTLKPGGLRELHWHPNADEWQYYISGKGRMTLFIAGADARTMDFEEGDVGYVPISNPHYIENTGDADLVFLEMFKSPNYEDISLAEWMAHTPHLLMDQHLGVGVTMLDNIPKQEVVIRPA
jgi:oxalate decarboxylase